MKFAALCLIATCLAAQTLEVNPPHIMCDESAVISVHGLAAGEDVRIRAELTDGVGHHWNSEAEFAADASGAIDLSRQAQIGRAHV